MLGIVVIGQDVAGTQIAGNDCGVVDHSLENGSFDQQGVEIVALDIPAVLGSGILQAGNSVNAFAVIAVGLCTGPDVLGDGGEQIGCIFGQHPADRPSD